MRRTLAKAFLALMLLSDTGALLSACNTVQGAGEDISATGRAIGRAVGSP
jgi:predicted small secreted protein